MSGEAEFLVLPIGAVLVGAVVVPVLAVGGAFYGAYKLAQGTVQVGGLAADLAVDASMGLVRTLRGESEGAQSDMCEARRKQQAWSTQLEAASQVAQGEAAQRVALTYVRATEDATLAMLRAQAESLWRRIDALPAPAPDLQEGSARLRERLAATATLDAAEVAATLDELDAIAAAYRGAATVVPGPIVNRSQQEQCKVLAAQLLTDVETNDEQGGDGEPLPSGGTPVTEGARPKGERAALARRVEELLTLAQREPGVALQGLQLAAGQWRSAQKTQAARTRTAVDLRQQVIACGYDLLAKLSAKQNGVPWDKPLGAARRLQEDLLDMLARPGSLTAEAFEKLRHEIDALYAQSEERLAQKGVQDFVRQQIREVIQGLGYAVSELEAPGSEGDEAAQAGGEMALIVALDQTVGIEVRIGADANVRTAAVATADGVADLTAAQEDHVCAVVDRLVDGLAERSLAVTQGPRRPHRRGAGVRKVTTKRRPAGSGGRVEPRQMRVDDSSGGS